MTPEISNPLQNPNIPSRIRWDTQRCLRCKELDADDHPQQQQPPAIQSNSLPRSEDGSQIEAIGQKLNLDFKLRMNYCLEVVVGGGADEDQDKEKEKTAEAPAEEGNELSQSWNLRTRRSPAPGPKRQDNSSSLKRARRGGSISDEKLKVRVPLKTEEIEEDFLLMTGIKPRRRPKKRPRAIQKQLDTLFPGLLVKQVTRKNNDAPEARKS